MAAEKSQREIELEQKYNSIMSRRRSISERPNDRDMGTNWNTDGSVRKTKRANMMGEGLGNSMGLDAPKFTRSYEPGELERIEEADKEFRAGIRFKQSLRKKKYQLIDAIFNEKLETRIREGKLLYQQRIFIAYPKDNWDIRAEKLGGIPDGVDIAESKFGHLLIVPVIETEESRYSDPYGRKFTIERNLRDRVNQIFGAVKWTRPLTLKDVEQFGVEVQ